MHRRRSDLAADDLSRQIDELEGELNEALGPLEIIGEPSAAVPDGPALCASVGRREQLIEYQAIDGELWAFVIRRQGISARPLGRSVEAIDALAGDLDYQLARFRLGDAFRQRHADGLKRGADGVLDELGRVLLSPLGDELGGRTIFVPTGVLHNVPFSALRTSQRYLVELGAVSVAPSVLAYGQLQRAPRGRRAPLVVAAGAESAPEVRREARHVAKLLPGSRLLIDEAAARATLAKEVEGRRLIHIATHGLFRPSHPLLTSLQLGDGWLTLHDVFELRLSADLVTVAACQSGRSHVAAGDELFSLARGFLQSGARSVLVGQWELDDRSARRVMSAFYRGYRARRSKTDALRAAVLAEKARSPHPFFWAPYVLVGAG